MNRLENAFAVFPTSAPLDETERRRQLMLQQALQAKALTAGSNMLSPPLPSQLTAPSPMSSDLMPPDRGNALERAGATLAKGDFPDAPPPSRGVDTEGFGGSVSRGALAQALRGPQGPGGNMLGKVAMPPELQGLQVGIGPGGAAYANPYLDDPEEKEEHRPPPSVAAGVPLGTSVYEPARPSSGMVTGSNATPVGLFAAGGRPQAGGSDRLDAFSDLMLGWASGANVQDSLAKGVLMLREGRKSREEKQATNKTVEYLVGRGMDPDVARFVAQDKQALTSILKSWVQGTAPDYEMTTIYDGQGREVKALVDKRTGEFKPIGGAKSDLMSPEEMEQRRQLAEAGRSSVNVNSGENEYGKTLGKADAETFIGIRNAGRSAQGTLATLDRMDALVTDPNFYSGAGGDLVRQFRTGIVALGGDPNAAAPMEEFQQLSNRAALDSMGGSLGAGFSNADRDFVTAQVPTLAASPEGNRSRIEVMRRIERRKVQIAKMAEDYAARNGGRLDAGFDAELRRFSEANPLFADLQQAKPTFDRSELEAEARRRGLVQ